MVLVGPVDAMAVQPTIIVYQRRLKSRSRICPQDRTTMVKPSPPDPPMKKLVLDQRHKRSRNRWPIILPIWSCHVKIVGLLSLRCGGETWGAEQYVMHAVGIAVRLNKMSADQIQGFITSSTVFIGLLA